MTPEELFEPKVMFFGLTSSLAIFQTMMNKILKNLINTGEVASFINNIIVGTEEEEKHNEVVEEYQKTIHTHQVYLQRQYKRQKYKIRLSKQNKELEIVLHR